MHFAEDDYEEIGLVARQAFARSLATFEDLDVEVGRAVTAAVLERLIGSFNESIQGLIDESESFNDYDPEPDGAWAADLTRPRKLPATPEKPMPTGNWLYEEFFYDSYKEVTLVHEGEFLRRRNIVAKHADPRLVLENWGYDPRIMDIAKWTQLGNCN